MTIQEFAHWRYPCLDRIGELSWAYERCRCDRCRERFLFAVEDYDRRTG